MPTQLALQLHSEPGPSLRELSDSMDPSDRYGSYIPPPRLRPAVSSIVNDAGSARWSSYAADGSRTFESSFQNDVFPMSSVEPPSYGRTSGVAVSQTIRSRSHQVNASGDDIRHHALRSQHGARWEVARCSGQRWPLRTGVAEIRSWVPNYVVYFRRAKPIE